MLNYTITQAKIPLRLHLLFAVMGLVGVAIILIATSNFGAGLTPDSIGYLAATRSLLAGKGVLWYNGDPIDIWPPLYPVMLAIVNKVFGVDFLASVHVINAIFFGLIVYLSGILFFNYLVSVPSLAILGSIYVLLSNSLFSVSVMAWSEPVFILCVLLFILSIDAYLEKGDRIYFVILTLSAMLACLTRYIGVTLIMSGIASILILGKTSLRNKLTFSSIFAFISAFPLGLWLIRNYLVGGTIAGYREPSKYTVFDNINFTLEAIIRWFLPGRLVSLLSGHYLLGIISVGFVGLLCILLISYSSKLTVDINRLVPIALFTTTYLAFLIYTATKIAFEQIENRYVSPVFILIVLMGLLLIETLWEVLKKTVKLPSQTIKRFISIAFATLLLLPLSSTIVNLSYWRTEGGGGYNSKIWRESQTIAYLKNKTLQKQNKIYSNDPYALYLYTDIIAKTVRYIKPELSSFKGSESNSAKAYLIWFHDSHRGYFDTPDDLKSIVNVLPMTQLGDGTIYTIQGKK